MGRFFMGVLMAVGVLAVGLAGVAGAALTLDGVEMLSICAAGVSGICKVAWCAGAVMYGRGALVSSCLVVSGRSGHVVAWSGRALVWSSCLVVSGLVWSVWSGLVRYGAAGRGKGVVQKLNSSNLEQPKKSTAPATEYP